MNLPPDEHEQEQLSRLRWRLRRAMFFGPPILLVFMVASTGSALIGLHLTPRLLTTFIALLATTVVSGILYLLITERRGRWRALVPAASFAPIFVLLVISMRQAGWNLHAGVLPGVIAGISSGIIAWYARSRDTSDPDS